MYPLFLCDGKIVLCKTIKEIIIKKIKNSAKLYNS